MNKDAPNDQKSNSIALWSLTTLITIQLITWVFWGAWFTFATINNTKLLEEIHQHKLPSRVDLLEHKVDNFDKLFNKLADKIDTLSEEVRKSKH